MEASAGLVAGSHNRNEFVVIHGHEEVGYLCRTFCSRRHCSLCPVCCVDLKFEKFSFSSCRIAAEAFERVEWPRLPDLW